MSIEWPLVFFTLLVGLGCGTFVGSVVMTEWQGKAVQIRPASLIVALAALVLGGLSSVLHLGHPERIFAALGHPTSGIFLEALMIGLVGLDIIIYLIALQRKAGGRTRKIIGTIGIIPAVILAFAVGYSYVMPSRPAWDTLILPLFYVASAGVIGCFSLSVLIGLAKRTGKAAQGALDSNLAPIPDTTAAVTMEAAAAAGETTVTAAVPIKGATLIALAIQAVLLMAYLIHLAVAPYPEATRSATRLFSGDLAPLFWLGLVVVGFLLPIMLIAQLYTRKAGRIPFLTLVNLGLASVLIGGVSFRVLMFSLGSSVIKFF